MLSRIPLTIAVILVMGCSGSPVGPGDEAPWKASDGGVVITAAPDAGGLLSFRNCPTLDEATHAMPSITAGPDANAVPFKSMVLQCSYALPGRDVQQRPAGISILVFDALAEGRPTWEWVVDGDPARRTAIADLGDQAFATNDRGPTEVWVNAGRFGLHLLHTSEADLPVSAMAALARAALDGLQRPPR
jgi:hypothetical protein